MKITLYIFITPKLEVGNLTRDDNKPAVILLKPYLNVKQIEADVSLQGLGNVYL